MAGDDEGWALGLCIKGTSGEPFYGPILRDHVTTLRAKCSGFYKRFGVSGCFPSIVGQFLLSPQSAHRVTKKAAASYSQEPKLRI